MELNITLEFYKELFWAAGMVLSFVASMIGVACLIFVRHTELSKQLAKVEKEIRRSYAAAQDRTNNRILNTLGLIVDQGTRLSKIEEKARAKDAN